jgi:hypothetical protein
LKTGKFPSEIFFLMGLTKELLFFESALEIVGITWAEYRKAKLRRIKRISLL